MSTCNIADLEIHCILMLYFRWTLPSHWTTSDNPSPCGVAQ